MSLIKFRPIYQERVWGGQNLRKVFNRPIPADKPIGESWEICDRPEAQTVVEGGPWAGLTFHEVLCREAASIMGKAPLSHGRFPLLIKFLDAQQRLSLQVHPPDHCARELRGEPKTEMWFIAQAQPGAHLIAGLKHGVTREEFEQALQKNTLESLCHRFPVSTGDAMFLPSGRLHAIDAGNVIVEIQQNSDTTYRVYDWGRPRELHIPQSLRSIDFDDFEPALSARVPAGTPASPDPLPLAACEYFTVDHFVTDKTCDLQNKSGRFAVWICLSGLAHINDEAFAVGDVVLLPASLKRIHLSIQNGPLRWLRVTT
ncbi:MAG: type I phosphomannose isomerase catalytic subunit [Verrucomicrobiae bacterium]|nr:type I phosphomannose isomerase catalytic subunit [Verrucomicrobiae bacterium]